MNLQTKYLGLTINSPIIVGSCGLTNDVENLMKIEKAGAGAVILKSLFEEQISYEISRVEKTMSDQSSYYESHDYIQQHLTDHEISRYLDLIRTAKKQLSIPIIASINCVSYDKWISFAKKIEDAGADALELNIHFLPSNINLSADDVEKLFEDIISTLKKSIRIPVSIKCGTYFSNLAKFMQKISWMGIKGLTLFNRGFSLDINIEEETYVPCSTFSHREELYNTLRWVAILGHVVHCDIAASTGVQKGEDAIKLLLAGASAVQVVSCLYKNGIPYIETLNKEIETWMQEKNYQKIEDFKGKMSMKSIKNPDALLRIQFMKYFSGIE